MSDMTIQHDGHTRRTSDVATRLEEKVSAAVRHRERCGENERQVHLLENGNNDHGAPISEAAQIQ